MFCFFWSYSYDSNHRSIDKISLEIMTIIYPMRGEIKFDECDTHEFSISWKWSKYILFLKIYMIYRLSQRGTIFFHIKLIIKNHKEYKIYYNTLDTTFFPYKINQCQMPWRRIIIYIFFSFDHTLCLFQSTSILDLLLVVRSMSDVINDLYTYCPFKTQLILILIFITSHILFYF